MFHINIPAPATRNEVKSAIISKNSQSTLYDILTRELTSDTAETAKEKALGTLDGIKQAWSGLSPVADNKFIYGLTGNYIYSKHWSSGANYFGNFGPFYILLRGQEKCIPKLDIISFLGGYRTVFKIKNKLQTQKTNINSYKDLLYDYYIYLFRYSQFIDNIDISELVVNRLISLENLTSTSDACETMSSFQGDVNIVKQSMRWLSKTIMSQVLWYNSTNHTSDDFNEFNIFMQGLSEILTSTKTLNSLSDFFDVIFNVDAFDAMNISGDYDSTIAKFPGTFDVSKFWFINCMYENIAKISGDKKAGYYNLKERFYILNACAIDTLNRNIFRGMPLNISDFHFDNLSLIESEFKSYFNNIYTLVLFNIGKYNKGKKNNSDVSDGNSVYTNANNAASVFHLLTIGPYVKYITFDLLLKKYNCYSYEDESINFFDNFYADINSKLASLKPLIEEVRIQGTSRNITYSTSIFNILENDNLSVIDKASIIVDGILKQFTNAITNKPLYDIRLTAITRLASIMYMKSPGLYTNESIAEKIKSEVFAINPNINNLFYTLIPSEIDTDVSRSIIIKDDFLLQEALENVLAKRRSSNNLGLEIFLGVKKGSGDRTLVNEEKIKNAVIRSINVMTGYAPHIVAKKLTESIIDIFNDRLYDQNILVANLEKLTLDILRSKFIESFACSGDTDANSEILNNTLWNYQSKVIVKEFFRYVKEELDFYDTIIDKKKFIIDAFAKFNIESFNVVQTESKSIHDQCLRTLREIRENALLTSTINTPVDLDTLTNNMYVATCNNMGSYNISNKFYIYSSIDFLYHLNNAFLNNDVFKNSTKLRFEKTLEYQDIKYLLEFYIWVISIMEQCYECFYDSQPIYNSNTHLPNAIDESNFNTMSQLILQTMLSCLSTNDNASIIAPLHPIIVDSIKFLIPKHIIASLLSKYLNRVFSDVNELSTAITSLSNDFSNVKTKYSHFDYSMLLIPGVHVSKYNFDTVFAPLNNDSNNYSPYEISSILIRSFSDYLDSANATTHRIKLKYQDIINSQENILTALITPSITRNEVMNSLFDQVFVQYNDLNNIGGSIIASVPDDIEHAIISRDYAQIYTKIKTELSKEFYITSNMSPNTTVANKMVTDIVEGLKVINEDFKQYQLSNKNLELAFWPFIMICKLIISDKGVSESSLITNIEKMSVILTDYIVDFFNVSLSDIPNKILFIKESFKKEFLQLIISGIDSHRINANTKVKIEYPQLIRLFAYLGWYVKYYIDDILLLEDKKASALEIISNTKILSKLIKTNPSNTFLEKYYDVFAGFIVNDSVTLKGDGIPIYFGTDYIKFDSISSVTNRFCELIQNLDINNVFLISDRDYYDSIFGITSIRPYLGMAFSGAKLIDSTNQNDDQKMQLMTSVFASCKDVANVFVTQVPSSTQDGTSSVRPITKDESLNSIKLIMNSFSEYVVAPSTMSGRLDEIDNALFNTLTLGLEPIDISNVFLSIFYGADSTVNLIDQNSVNKGIDTFVQYINSFVPIGEIEHYVQVIVGAIQGTGLTSDMVKALLSSTLSEDEILEVLVRSVQQIKFGITDMQIAVFTPVLAGSIAVIRNNMQSNSINDIINQLIGDFVKFNNNYNLDVAVEDLRNDLEGQSAILQADVYDQLAMNEKLALLLELLNYSKMLLEVNNDKVGFESFVKSVFIDKLFDLSTLAKSDQKIFIDKFLMLVTDLNYMGYRDASIFVQPFYNAIEVFENNKSIDSSINNHRLYTLIFELYKVLFVELVRNNNVYLLQKIIEEILKIETYIISNDSKVAIIINGIRNGRGGGISLSNDMQQLISISLGEIVVDFDIGPSSRLLANYVINNNANELNDNLFNLVRSTFKETFKQLKEAVTGNIVMADTAVNDYALRIIKYIRAYFNVGPELDKSIKIKEYLMFVEYYKYLRITTTPIDLIDRQLEEVIDVLSVDMTFQSWSDNFSRLFINLPNNINALISSGHIDPTKFNSYIEYLFYTNDNQNGTIMYKHLPERFKQLDDMKQPTDERRDVEKALINEVISDYLLTYTRGLGAIPSSFADLNRREAIVNTIKRIIAFSIYGITKPNILYNISDTDFPNFSDKVYSWLILYQEPLPISNISEIIISSFRSSLSNLIPGPDTLESVKDGIVKLLYNIDIATFDLLKNSNNALALSNLLSSFLQRSDLEVKLQLIVDCIKPTDANQAKSALRRELNSNILSNTEIADTITSLVLHQYNQTENLVDILDSVLKIEKAMKEAKSARLTGTPDYQNTDFINKSINLLKEMYQIPLSLDLKLQNEITVYIKDHVLSRFFTLLITQYINLTDSQEFAPSTLRDSFFNIFTETVANYYNAHLLLSLTYSNMYEFNMLRELLLDKSNYTNNRPSIKEFIKQSFNSLDELYIQLVSFDETATASSNKQQFLDILDITMNLFNRNLNQRYFDINDIVGFTVKVINQVATVKNKISLIKAKTMIDDIVLNYLTFNNTNIQTNFDYLKSLIKIYILGTEDIINISHKIFDYSFTQEMSNHTYSKNEIYKNFIDLALSIFSSKNTTGDLNEDTLIFEDLMSVILNYNYRVTFSNPSIKSICDAIAKAVNAGMITIQIIDILNQPINSNADGIMAMQIVDKFSTWVTSVSNTQYSDPIINAIKAGRNTQDQTKIDDLKANILALLNAQGVTSNLQAHFLSDSFKKGVIHVDATSGNEVSDLTSDQVSSMLKALLSLLSTNVTDPIKLFIAETMSSMICDIESKIDNRIVNIDHINVTLQGKAFSIEFYTVATTEERRKSIIKDIMTYSKDLYVYYSGNSTEFNDLLKQSLSTIFLIDVNAGQESFDAFVNHFTDIIYVSFFMNDVAGNMFTKGVTVRDVMIDNINALFGQLTTITPQQLNELIIHDEVEIANHLFDDLLEEKWNLSADAFKFLIENIFTYVDQQYNATLENKAYVISMFIKNKLVLTNVMQETLAYTIVKTMENNDAFYSNIAYAMSLAKLSGINPVVDLIIVKLNSDIISATQASNINILIAPTQSSVASTSQTYVNQNIDPEQAVIDITNAIQGSGLTIDMVKALLSSSLTHEEIFEICVRVVKQIKFGITDLQIAVFAPALDESITMLQDNIQSTSIDYIISGFINNIVKFNNNYDLDLAVLDLRNDLETQNSGTVDSIRPLINVVSNILEVTFIDIPRIFAGNNQEIIDSQYKILLNTLIYNIFMIDVTKPSQDLDNLVDSIYKLIMDNPAPDKSFFDSVATSIIMIINRYQSINDRFDRIVYLRCTYLAKTIEEAISTKNRALFSQTMQIIFYDDNIISSGVDNEEIADIVASSISSVIPQLDKNELLQAFKFALDNLPYGTAKTDIIILSLSDSIFADPMKVDTIIEDIYEDTITYNLTSALAGVPPIGSPPGTQPYDLKTIIIEILEYSEIQSAKDLNSVADTYKEKVKILLFPKALKIENSNVVIDAKQTELLQAIYEAHEYNVPDSIIADIIVRGVLLIQQDISNQINAINNIIRDLRSEYVLEIYIHQIGNAIVKKQQDLFETLTNTLFAEPTSSSHSKAYYLTEGISVAFPTISELQKTNIANSLESALNSNTTQELMTDTLSDLIFSRPVDLDAIPVYIKIDELFDDLLKMNVVDSQSINEVIVYLRTLTNTQYIDFAIKELLIKGIFKFNGLNDAQESECVLVFTQLLNTISDDNVVSNLILSIDKSIQDDEALYGFIRSVIIMIMNESISLNLRSNCVDIINNVFATSIFNDEQRSEILTRGLIGKVYMQSQLIHMQNYIYDLFVAVDGSYNDLLSFITTDILDEIFSDVNDIDLDAVLILFRRQKFIYDIANAKTQDSLNGDHEATKNVIIEILDYADILASKDLYISLMRDTLITELLGFSGLQTSDIEHLILSIYNIRNSNLSNEEIANVIIQFIDDPKDLSTLNKIIEAINSGILTRAIDSNDRTRFRNTMIKFLESTDETMQYKISMISLAIKNSSAFNTMTSTQQQEIEAAIQYCISENMPVNRISESISSRIFDNRNADTIDSIPIYLNIELDKIAIENANVDNTITQIEFSNIITQALDHITSLLTLTIDAETLYKNTIVSLIINSVLNSAEYSLKTEVSNKTLLAHNASLNNNVISDVYITNIYLSTLITADAKANGIISDLTHYINSVNAISQPITQAIYNKNINELQASIVHGLTYQNVSNNFIIQEMINGITNAMILDQTSIDKLSKIISEAMTLQLNANAVAYIIANNLLDASGNISVNISQMEQDFALFKIKSYVDKLILNSDFVGVDNLIQKALDYLVNQIVAGSTEAQIKSIFEKVIIDTVLSLENADQSKKDDLSSSIYAFNTNFGSAVTASILGLILSEPNTGLTDDQIVDNIIANMQAYSQGSQNRISHAITIDDKQLFYDEISNLLNMPSLDMHSKIYIILHDINHDDNNHIIIPIQDDKILLDMIYRLTNQLKTQEDITDFLSEIHDLIFGPNQNWDYIVNSIYTYILLVELKKAIIIDSQSGDFDAGRVIISDIVGYTRNVYKNTVLFEYCTDTLMFDLIFNNTSPQAQSEVIVALKNAFDAYISDREISDVVILNFLEQNHEIALQNVVKEINILIKSQSGIREIKNAIDNDSSTVVDIELAISHVVNDTNLNSSDKIISIIYGILESKYFTNVDSFDLKQVFDALNFVLQERVSAQEITSTIAVQAYKPVFTENVSYILPYKLYLLGYEYHIENASNLDIGSDRSHIKQAVEEVINMATVLIANSNTNDRVNRCKEIMILILNAIGINTSTPEVVSLVDQILITQGRAISIDNLLSIFFDIIDDLAKNQSQDVIIAGAQSATNSVLIIKTLENLLIENTIINYQDVYNAISEMLLTGKTLNQDDRLKLIDIISNTMFVASQTVKDALMNTFLSVNTNTLEYATSIVTQGLFSQDMDKMITDLNKVERLAYINNILETPSLWQLSNGYNVALGATGLSLANILLEKITLEQSFGTSSTEIAKDILDRIMSSFSTGLITEEQRNSFIFELSNLIDNNVDTYKIASVIANSIMSNVQSGSVGIIDQYKVSATMNLIINSLQALYSAEVVNMTQIVDSLDNNMGGNTVVLNTLNRNTRSFYNRAIRR